MAKLRRRRALEKWLRGETYQKIADDLGWSHRGTAYAAIQDALRELPVDLDDSEVNSHRRRMAAQLSELCDAHWLKATGQNGHEVDAKSAGIALRALAQQAQLLGLNVQTSAESVGSGAASIGATIDFAVHQIIEHDADPHDLAAEMYPANQEAASEASRRLSVLADLQRQVIRRRAEQADVVDVEVVEVVDERQEE